MIGQYLSVGGVLRTLRVWMEERIFFWCPARVTPIRNRSLEEEEEERKRERGKERKRERKKEGERKKERKRERKRERERERGRVRV